MNTKEHSLKKIAVSPPRTPLSVDGDKVDVEGSGEKIYISHAEHEGNASELSYDQHVDVDSIEREEKREREIYIFHNSVIPQLKRKRGPYRNNAIRNRCRIFAQQFYEMGYNYGCQIDLPEMKHWIVALDLAHDKITVNQYLHRLCLYGYFYLETNGKFTFLTALPGQNPLDVRVVRKQQIQLEHALSHKPIPRRNY